MTDRIGCPASRPCGSCPYRQDVPSGVWAAEEYEKLPEFDLPTGEQPASVFMCHQQNDRLCAGWVAVHDMDESLGLRLAVAMGAIDPADQAAVLDYSTDVPLWPSGAEAAAHGVAEIEDPDPQARRIVAKLERRRR
jgi:hypothetical protein